MPLSKARTTSWARSRPPSSHAVLALAACLISGYARWRRPREHGLHSGHLGALAPVGAAAAARIALTVRSAARGAGGAGRVLLAAVPPR
jgi:hypothetical protein